MRIDRHIKTLASYPSSLITAKSYLGVVDCNCNIFFVRDSALSAIQKYNSPLACRRYNANSASSDGKKISLWIEGKKSQFVFGYELSKKAFGSISKLEGIQIPPTASAFCKSGQIIATGFDTGEIYIYHVPTGKMLLELPKAQGTITSIEFDSTSTIVTYLTNPKEITIFSINENQILHRYHHKKLSDITTISYLKREPVILFGTTDGEVGILNYVTKEISYYKRSNHSQITKIYSDNDDNFILVANNSCELYIAGTKSEEKNLEIVGTLDANVTDIGVQGNMLTLLLQNGVIAQIEHKKNIALLQEQLTKKDAKAVIVLGKNYPLLRYTRQYKGLDLIFEENLKKAYDLIAGKEFQKAKQLLSPYQQDPRYKIAIKSFENSKNKITSFAEIVASNRIEQAYSLAGTNELYKTLQIYKELEDKFSQSLSIAVRSSERKDMVTATKVVEPYMRIPAKSKLIAAVFSAPTIFKVGNTLIQNGDFEQFKNLLEKYPILTNTPCNLKYKESAQKTINEFLNCYEDGQTSKALAKSEEIEKVYTPYYPKIQEVATKVKISLGFENAVINKNFQSAIAYILRNDFLQTHPNYDDVILYYNQIFLTATNYALTLKFDAMNALLLPMLKITIFKERSIGVYHIYYLTELEKLKLKREEQEQLILYILESFGMTKLLQIISKKIGLEEFVIENQSKSANNFINNPIIPPPKRV